MNEFHKIQHIANTLPFVDQNISKIWKSPFYRTFEEIDVFCAPQDFFGSWELCNLIVLFVP